MLNLMNRSSVNVMISSSMNDLVKAYIYMQSKSRELICAIIGGRTSIAGIIEDDLRQ